MELRDELAAREASAMKDAMIHRIGFREAFLRPQIFDPMSLHAAAAECKFNNFG
jgi:hypothetical protein